MDVSSTRDDSEILDEVLAALVLANDQCIDGAPDLFTRSGVLHCVDWDDRCTPVLTPIVQARLAEYVCRACRFTKWVWNERRRRLVESDVGRPPEPVVRMLHQMGEPPLPVVRQLASVPGLLGDGSVQDRPGFDPVSGRLFLSVSDQAWIPVPEAPSEEDVERAKGVILDQLLADFPFVGEADRANAVGMLLTPLVRCLFRGQVPLHGIDAPSWGTGKTLLAMLAQMVAGEPAGDPKEVPTEAEERRKTIQTTVMAGKEVIILDNWTTPLEGGGLCAVLTAPVISFRRLGAHQNIAVENRFLFIATGNNMSVVGDMVRRVTMIRLDAGLARPMERDGFTVELPGWLEENRQLVVWALLVLARGWITAGRPAPAKTMPVSRSENFGDWAWTVGGIVHWAGIEGFMENRSEVLDADPAPAEWGAFVSAIARHLEAGGQLLTDEDGTVRTAKFTAKNVSQQIVDKGLWGNCELATDIARAAPEELGEVTKGDLPKRIGRAFRRQRGTRYPSVPWVVTDAGKDGDGVTLWQLVRRG